MGTERDFIPAPDALIKGLLECLHHTLRSERGADPVADDQMIHEPDIDKFHGRPNAVRNPLVGLAWFSDGRASGSAWQGPDKTEATPALHPTSSRRDHGPQPNSCWLLCPTWTFSVP